jgi:hypothetical protein
MTSASGASPTETSFNDLESSAHFNNAVAVVSEAAGPPRRGKRKTRTSPSGSRAAHSDVTSQVDSGDDADEATNRSQFEDRRMRPPALKRSRGRRLNSSSYAQLQYVIVFS